MTSKLLRSEEINITNKNFCCAGKGVLGHSNTSLYYSIYRIRRGPYSNISSWEIYHNL